MHCFNCFWYLSIYHFFWVVLVVLINLSQEGHHLDVQDLIRSSPASILDYWFLLDGDWSEFLEQGPILRKHVQVPNHETHIRSLRIYVHLSYSQLLSGCQYDFPMPKVIDINTRPDTTVTARPWKSIVGRWHFLLGPSLFSRGQAVIFREWELYCLNPLPQAAKLARLNPGGADSDKLVPMAANDGGTGCSRYQLNKLKRITNAYTKIWD